jgi:SAM-dependent methyltransferase
MSELSTPYHGTKVMINQDQEHLGGSIVGGDPLTFSPRVWNYCIDRFGVESVLDIGSGSGNAALYFYRKGLRVLAVEGLVESVLGSLYPAIKHDITKEAVITKVDLVHCQEVVEHIEEQYLDNLLSSLTTGKYILMTHAVPGQGGHHHVNCQPSEYWIDHFSKRNCSFLAEDTQRIRKLAIEDGAKFMSNTGMLFANYNRF